MTSRFGFPIPGSGRKPPKPKRRRQAGWPGGDSFSHSFRINGEADLSMSRLVPV